MNKFIKLTPYRGEKTLYLNVSHITKIEVDAEIEAVVIVTNNREYIEVLESIEEVMNLINN